jgi:hypothetical protein
MSKYRNVKVELDGYKFDSKREAEYYKELCLRKKAGDVKEFKIKPKFFVIIHSPKKEELHYIDWWPGGMKKDYPRFFKNVNVLFAYTPDFIVDGQLVDVKGFETPVFKLKAKILAALGLPVKVVK